MAFLGGRSAKSPAKTAMLDKAGNSLDAERRPSPFRARDDLNRTE
jgi:hypothetical protein